MFDKKIEANFVFSHSLCIFAAVLNKKNNKDYEKVFGNGNSFGCNIDSERSGV